MRQSAIVYLALLGGCSYEVRCGGSDASGEVVKKTELETNLATALRAQGLNVTGTHCDTEDIPPQVGAVVTCEVELDGKKSYGAHATITARNGEHLDAHVLLDVPRAVDAHKVEREITAQLAKQLDIQGTVDCREPIRSIPDSNVVACDAVLDGYAHVLDVHFDDQQAFTQVTFGTLTTRQSIADAIATKHPEGHLDCGADPLVAPDGLECSLTGVAGFTRATFHYDASATELSWDLTP
jgi:hypothetical protein